MEKFRIQQDAEAKVASWLKERGGIAIWRSAKLANPAASWTCPVNGPDGQPTPKPSWQAHQTPERIITDPNEIEVEVGKVFERVPVSAKSNGMQFTLTDGCENKIMKALDRAGNGSWYEFDYLAREAVVFCLDQIRPMSP